jgi:hypothetical protein
MQGIQEIPGLMALTTAGIDGSLRLWKIASPDVLEPAVALPPPNVEVR